MPVHAGARAPGHCRAVQVLDAQPQPEGRGEGLHLRLVGLDPHPLHLGLAKDLEGGAILENHGGLEALALLPQVTRRHQAQPAQRFPRLLRLACRREQLLFGGTW